MLFFAKELRYHDKEEICFPRKGCASVKLFLLVMLHLNNEHE